MLQTFKSWRCQGVFFLVGQILAGWILVGLVPVQAETSGVVISGFQVSGGPGRTNEEYVELYNSTAESVNISGWRLAKLTKTGTPGSWTYLMTAFAANTVLPAHTFALAVHTDASPIFGGDWQYGSSTLAEDNSVVLLNASGAAVDLVGWGQALNFTVQALPTAGSGRWARILSTEGALGNFVRTEGDPRQGLVDAAVPIIENLTSTSTPEGEPSTSTEVLPQSEVTSTPEVVKAENVPEASPVMLDIILSEVYSQPNADESEYIELYNPNESEVELVDWEIIEGGGSLTVVTGTIAAKGFLVVTPIKGSLNNAGDEVQLWHGEEVIDVVAYGEWNEGVVTPAKGQSVLRTDLVLSGAWVLGGSSSGAPNVALVVTEETVDEDSEAVMEVSGKLKISEVLPDPAGVDAAEFIELFNPTTAAILTNQWRLEAAGQEFWLPDQVIAPGAYVVFYRTQSKLVLPNRKKEKVRLLRADGSLSDSISYAVPTVSGAAWLNVPGRGWEWSQSSTPGLANVWKQLNRAPYAEITGPAEVFPGEVVALNSDNVYDPDQDVLQYHWDLGDGQQTTSTGISTVYEKAGKYKVTLIVTDPFGLKDEVGWVIQVATPVVVGKPIATSTVGIASIKKGAGSAPKPSVKKAASTAKVATAKPKTKVVAKSTTVTPTGPALPMAARLLVENEGKLVSIKGEITSGSGKYWRLDDGTNEVVVILPATKQPTSFGLKKGTVWQVSGVVKKYKEDWAVAPSEWGQLKIMGKELVAAKAVSAMPVNAAVFKKLWWLLPGVLMVVVLYFGIRKHKAPALIPVSVV